MQNDRWTIVIAAGLAVFMATLDASIVNVALPTLAQAFGAAPGAIQWAVLAYLLASLALVMPAGRWLDSVGRREGFMFAVAGFAVSSAGCGIAPGLAWLIGARAAQGAFGALLAASVPALVAGAVGPRARGRALGLIGAIGPLGAASGPALGGALIATLGWRAIFFANLPVCLSVLLIAKRAIAPGRRLAPPPRGLALETVLVGSAVGAFFGGISLAELQGLPWLGLSLLVLPITAIWRRRASAAALGRLGGSGAREPLLALALLATASAALTFTVPFYLERVLRLGPAAVGLTILAQPLAMAIAAPFGGYLADRFGARRTSAVGGAWVLGALVLVVPLAGDWHPLDLWWRLALVGAGMGFFAGPNLAALMSAVPRDALATAGAASSLARSLGWAVGPALATGIWFLTPGLLGLRVGIAAPAALAGVATLVLARGVGRSTPVPAAMPTRGAPSASDPALEREAGSA